MTGVLEHPLVSGSPGILASPRLRPGMRVLECEAIKYRVGIEPREPLGHLEVFARSPEPRLVREVSGLYHQGIAFPMTDGLAEPLADARWRVFAADPDDAPVMDHLVHDHHFRRRLNDLLQVVVQVVR